MSVTYTYVFQGLTLNTTPGVKEVRTPAISVTITGYRHSISFSAFRHGLKRKYRGKDHSARLRNAIVQNHRTYDPHTNMLWIGKSVDEYHIEQQMDSEYAERYAAEHPDVSAYFNTVRPNPTIHFDDVHAFFKYIRYDQKTKEFLPVVS